MKAYYENITKGAVAVLKVSSSIHCLTYQRCGLKY